MTWYNPVSWFGGGGSSSDSAAQPSGCPVDHSKMAAGAAAGGCPVDHSKMALSNTNGISNAAAGGCPIDHGGGGNNANSYNATNNTATNNNAVVLDPNNRDLKKDLKRLMASDSGACPYAAGNEAKRAALEAKNAKNQETNTNSLSNSNNLSGVTVESPGDGDKQMSHGDGYGESPNERINPLNMMPDMANKPLTGDSEEIEINYIIQIPDMANKPLVGDSVNFSRSREVSSIPKTDDPGTKWIYPSAQQFYNALRRRGKVEEQDQLEADNTMDQVIYAHNVTNERTWIEILDWERMYAHICKEPSLLRFVGKSEEFSPKAHFSNWFRKRGAPFDRHDWTIDRCGTGHVRYVIDYYDDPTDGDETLEITLDTRPALDSFDNFCSPDHPRHAACAGFFRQFSHPRSPSTRGPRWILSTTFAPQITLDTRPALDSFDNFWARMRRPFWLMQNPPAKGAKAEEEG